MIIRLICMLAAALLLLGGCDEQNGGSGPGKARGIGARKQYPVALSERKYQEVHADVKQAWLLQEIAYFVVKEKYAQATPATKAAVTQEVQNLFFVNNEVEALFRDAIKEQPDNALNHAAYAIYLKPRKRKTDTGYTNTYADALASIDKAIELWPDESSFYITKIHIMTAPHMAHDWLRTEAMEDLGIAAKMDEIDKLFSLAEKYDPQNSFINYWHAQILFRYTPHPEFDSIVDQLHREIASGNRKQDGFFIFGAPLSPRTDIPNKPLLYAEQTEPQFIDIWNQFGNFSGPTLNLMAQELLKKLTWPRDKQKILDIMYMYYNLGRMEPYDRSYFSMQAMVLDKIRREVDVKSAEAKQLATLGFYLDEQYTSVANRFYASHMITDPARVGGIGISDVESSMSRHEELKDLLQGAQASYLKKFEDLMGVDFPLPEDPEQW